MTQNTQTTAERIRDMIFDAIQGSPYGDESIVAAPLGATIAAEIDRLTAERDEARAQYRREKTITATLEHQLSGWNESYLKVEAERDEARAEVERLRPAAEAWEVFLKYHDAGYSIEACFTAARARATKGEA